MEVSEAQLWSTYALRRELKLEWFNMKLGPSYGRSPIPMGRYAQLCPTVSPFFMREKTASPILRKLLGEE